MASITFAVDDAFKERIEKFSWVNWSAVVREELRKQEVLLCETVESLKDISDPDRAETDLGRIAAAWDTMAQQSASGPDAAAARRFGTAAGAGPSQNQP